MGARQVGAGEEVESPARRAEYAELAALFFIHGAALSRWFGPSMMSGREEPHATQTLTVEPHASKLMHQFINGPALGKEPPLGTKLT